MPSAVRHPNRLLRLCAFLLLALLTSCSYLVYIPMLIIVPFMPLIQLAVKLGARYGPLLLMLVEADPQGVHYAPGLIQAGPAYALHANARHNCPLRTLDEQILVEVQSNRALRAIVVVEIAKLTPQWLEEQQRAAHARGETIRITFVDSRNPLITDATRATCLAANIPLIGTPGLAASVVSGSSTTLLELPSNTTAHATLLAALASVHSPQHSTH